jgi:hypothetical protein
MQGDGDDTHVAALQQTQKRESIRARNMAWFDSAVLEPYRRAASPYGDGMSTAIR